MTSDVWARRFLVTGGTGLIGSVILERISDAGGSALVLSRTAESKKASPKARIAYVGTLSSISLDTKFDVVINLAGESIAGKKWTVEQKQNLLDSRVETTRRLIDFLQRLQHKPSYFFSASAIGYYGDHAAEVIDENTARRACFSSDLCCQWEQEAQRAQQLGIPVGIGRFGVVFSQNGGSWLEFAKPLTYKLSTVFGSGEQWFSWVHINDVVAAIKFLIACGQAQTLNIVAPSPVKNKDLAKVLKKESGALLLAPVPKFVLQCALGEMADELLFVSQRVSSNALQALGFEFRYPDLGPCVKHLLNG